MGQLPHPKHVPGDCSPLAVAGRAAALKGLPLLSVGGFYLTANSDLGLGGLR